MSEQTEREELAINVGIDEELAKNVENPDDAAELIKTIDKMIKIKKNNIFMITYQQGKIFRKFNTNDKFKNPVSAFKISKATINLKTGIVEFIDKYPKMQKSYISLYYLKNFFRVINEVCQEHASEFQ